ncbi:hypothetical protein TNCV_1963681 [Trichonephila clavipes]|nr:hypothetical protein TNCV_1963681 [Trichonephila clavipes]
MALGTEVHDQSLLSGGQPDANPAVFSSPAQAWYSFFDPLKAERLSRSCSTRDLSPGTLVSKLVTLPLSHWLSCL